jgi:glycyl-tRNA synthetase beta chain
MSDYFFELLTEEIPAWMLAPKSVQIREELTRIAGAFAPDAKPSIEVGATSRRIYFSIGGLPKKQADREEEVKGPPLRAAFDAEGNPTQALQGFLKKQGALADAVTKRDDYVWLKRLVAGLDARSMLSREIPALIENLRWPKMMRWGAGEFAYIRPIHSIISILDGAPLEITIFGRKSGTTTEGHRILAPREINVTSFNDYRSQLAAAHVVIDPEERVKVMRETARKLAAEVGGTPASDESIWEQWKYLTEYPGLVRAEFEKRFIELPEEVLITVMRVHQKQLPVIAEGRITSSFLAVVDQTGDEDGNARHGNAFVTNARFADAKFFYETDRRRSLASRLADLEHLQFQEKLGDYRKKAERIVRLAEIVRQESAVAVDAAAVRRAAELCKTDLVTEMVKEFTDLQGKVGGIYAREEGEPDSVWQAVYDHYLPLSLEGEMPRGAEGAIVSLADKLDTIAGFFSIGLKPTGSRDPFALRRAAQGAIQILLSRAGWSIPASLDRLVDAALQGYGEAAPAVHEEIVLFLADRVKTILEAFPFNFAYDEIAAAMAPGWSASLHDLHDRLLALRHIRENQQFLSILDSAKRITNITAGAPERAIDESRLEHATEKRLASLVSLTGEQIDELIAARDYSSALDSFAAMAPELEQFFNDVMVMVDDQAVRENRVALLRRCGSLVGRIADVTKIVVDRRDYRPAE